MIFDLSDAIKKVIDYQGSEVLKESNIFYSLLLDFAPERAESINVLKKHVDGRLLNIFYELLNADVNNSEIYIMKIFNILHTETGLTNEWSNSIIQTFALSFGLKLDITVNNDAFSESKIPSKLEQVTKLVSNYNPKDIARFLSKKIAYTRGNLFFVLYDGNVLKYSEKHNTIERVVGWNDVVEVKCGDRHVVVLKKDGHVEAKMLDGAEQYRRCMCGQCNVDNWDEIVSIDAASHVTIGLKRDGTVLATGSNACGQCNVKKWKNIKAISTNGISTFGLTKDGKIVVSKDAISRITDSSAREKNRIAKSMNGIEEISGGFFKNYDGSVFYHHAYDVQSGEKIIKFSNIIQMATTEQYHQSVFILNDNCEVIRFYINLEDYGKDAVLWLGDKFAVEDLHLISIIPIGRDSFLGITKDGNVVSIGRSISISNLLNELGPIYANPEQYIDRKEGT